MKKLFLILVVFFTLQMNAFSYSLGPPGLDLVEALDDIAVTDNEVVATLDSLFRIADSLSSADRVDNKSLQAISEITELANEVIYSKPFNDNSIEAILPYCIQENRGALYREDFTNGVHDLTQAQFKMAYTIVNRPILLDTMNRFVYDSIKLTEHRIRGQDSLIFS